MEDFPDQTSPSPTRGTSHAASAGTYSTRKLLHILWELRYSGAEIMVHDAKDYFEAHHLAGTVLARGKELGAYAPTLERIGYPVYHLPARRTPGSFVALYRFLRQHPFDVIHLHPEALYLWHSLTIRLANPAARIVHTHHDVFFQYPPLLRQVRKFHRFLCRRVLGVKCVSIGESVQTVEKQYFNNDTAIVYNWIDEKEFRPPTPEQIAGARREIGLPENAFVLLTVGTCNDKKRHNDLFEAVARVKDRIPNLVFLHRGSGPNQTLEREYVRKLGIEKNVVFLDYIDSLPKVFWAADAFIFSSHWEGLGNVILQAIACRLPVILYAGWGMNDFRPADEVDRYGYWIDPATERFDEAILAMHARKQRGQIADWQEKAYAFYRKKFSSQQSLARMVAQYVD